MVEQYSGQSSAELPLLPAQGDIFFGGEEGILRYSEWNPRKIILSREGVKQVKGEIFISVSLGDFHRPWESLSGRVDGDTFIIESESSLLEALYNNQGSVAKTLNLIGGPLSTQKRKRFWRKWMKIPILAILLASLFFFGYEWWGFRASHIIEIKELTEHIVKLRGLVEQDQKQKEKLPEEIKGSEQVIPILNEQVKITTERVKLLESADKGTIKTITIVDAKQQLLDSQKELEREKGKVNSNKAELSAINQQAEELKKLSQRLETLKSDTYWGRYLTWLGQN